MPKFPSYQREQGLGGGSTASYASDGAFTAPARALAGLGGAIADVGQSFQAETDKIRATQDEAWFSKARAQTAVDMIAAEREAQQSATGEAASYMDDIGGRFKTYRDTKLTEAPSPRAQQLYTQWADGFGVGVTERASNFQAGSELAVRADNFSQAMNAHQQAIFADPTQYDAVYKRAKDDFEGAKQWMTPEQEAKAWEVTDRNLKLAWAKKLASVDPEKFLTEIGVRGGKETGGGGISSVVNRIVGAESGGDPNAQNSRSSAAGLGQFIDSTWVATVRKHRPDIAKGMSNDQIIELKSDAALAREMTTRHTEENAKGLASAGVPVTDGNVYLAHFAGLQGAKNILTAPDDTPIVDVLDAAAIKANPTVLGGGKTVADVKAWADGKMGKSGPAKAGGPVPNVQFIDATAGKIRDKPVQSWVRDGLARAAAATDSRIAIKIVSGGQDGAQRTGSKRHDHGNAADLILVVDGKEVKPSENKALYAAFFKNAAANGFKGLGHYEWGIHVGGGAQAAWGPDKSIRTLDPEFAKAAAEGWGNPAAAGIPEEGGAPQFVQNPRLAGLSVEDLISLQNQAEGSLRERAVGYKASIETAMQNAPTAIINTGEYTGQLPPRENFLAAYGPQNGEEKFTQFMDSVDAAKQSYSMRTMPEDQIAAIVNDARPTSSGDDAARQQQRYEVLSKSADTIIKMREADPASYVRQNFPSVAQAWDDASKSPEGFQMAVAASIAAQEQIGMSKIAPLPKDVATQAANSFKDEKLPSQERIAAVSSVILATPDTAQRKVIFNQLAEAGLPEVTEGAFAALERGDRGAADRLFQAAVVDLSKLPGKAPNTPAEIDGQIQTDLMDTGKIGDIYYGLSDGVIENFERAQRDSKLLSNAVTLRVRNGETLEAATAAAAKDLFGEVKAVTGDSRVNAQIIVPQGEDEGAILDGLAGLMPEVERALADVAIPNDAPTAKGERAIISAATENHNRNILTQGFFRSIDEGFVFIDPYNGTAIEGPDGNAVVFTREQVLSTKPAPPELLPTDQPNTMSDNVQTEMQMQEERVRKMYEGAQ